MQKLLILSFLLSGLFFAGYFSSCSDSRKVGSEEDVRVSYNFQVRPILSDKCFNCHGPDANKREAGLRLDIAGEAYKALKEHPKAHALVPGVNLNFRNCI